MLLFLSKKYAIKKSAFSALLLLLLSALCSFSNASSYRNDIKKFNHLSITDGLSQSYIYDIKQDSDGFIWIATQDGLNRYDGKAFVHYRHNNSPQSIADNFITKLFIDESNVLWVGTSSGLSRYNKQQDNFENFFLENNDKKSEDNRVWDIYQDNQKNIWVSTVNKLHKFNKKNNRFITKRFKQYEDELVSIKTIYQDKDQNYWLGTYDNGIYIIDKNFSETISLNENNEWQLQLDINSLFDIKIIENNYWLATDNGVYVVSQNYKVEKHYNNQNTDKTQILSNTVRTIEKIDDIRVWLGTSDGINQINLRTGEISSISSAPHRNALSENYVFKIFKDKYNIIWIGTNGAGINTYNPEQTKFTHGLFNFTSEIPDINSLIETRDEKIWYATFEGKVYYISKENNLPTLELSIEQPITHLISHNDSQLIISTYDNELLLYNLNNKSLIEVKEWYEKANFNIKNELFIVDDNIWFLDEDGLLKSFNLNTKVFNQFKHSLTTKFTSLKQHDKAKLYIANSENSLVEFSIKEMKFKETQYQLPETLRFEEITNIAISKNWIWFGSNEQGVASINKNSNKAFIYNVDNGLNNNFVASILLDNNENAWVSTNKGIHSINPFSSDIQSFGKDFNLDGNEYVSKSSLKSSSNIFYFGGLNGFHMFDPQEVSIIKHTLPTPILTKFLIANKKISTSTNNKLQLNEFSLEKSLNSLTNLTLQHEQSPFSIEFISPNVKLSERVKYKYRLKGFEDNWIESGINNLRATYTSPGAGNYTFEVQAYDIHNPESTRLRSLDITILPPWWLSTSAILVYALLILAIMAYFLQQLRHKRLYHLQIKLSEERLKLSLWGSGDEMWDWNIKTGRIYRSNIWGILEFPQDGRRNVGPEQANIHKQDIPRVRQALTDHFDNKSDHFESTYRVKDKNDRWIWVLDRGKVVERDDNKKPMRMTGTLKDISQIKKTEENLKLFAKCIENISDAVIIYNRQFQVVDVNKAYQRITKKSKSAMLGKYLNFSRYPNHFTEKVKKHLLSKGTWHGEIESYRGDKESYLTDLNIDIIRDENNNISHYVGVFSDITKRKETEAELRKLASSDTLTGLPNRSYFQANQTRLVKAKIPHALLVFDLDNFKKINDSMGHEVGDVLLCMVAERMLNIGRKQDTVYRLGGDEFSLLIENTNDIHTITSIAKEILITIAQPFKLKNQEVVLYSSIGIVLYPEDGTSPQELLKNADTAMYHAKDLGGNKYQFFSDSMNKQAVKRLQLENLIRHGLKEDLFSVFYQPKIEITTGKVAGMEALVRFETPSKGIISPVVFIPVSEETGQIIDIGEVVLRKSCFAAKKWLDDGLFDGRVAVNLSAVQFTQPNLVGMIVSILKESKLPPKHLELEITEGTVMDSPQKAIDTMLQIREMGIHLSLDDFGTGYSSLAYLKKFPLNTLKIDKAFVDDIEHSEQGRNMVATIVTIAHNLGLQVVAEGVESSNQLSFLSGLRCEQLQGYLYSKPLPEKDFHKYLMSHKITNSSAVFGRS